MQIKLESTPEREGALFDLASTKNWPAFVNLLDIGTNPNALKADGTERTPLHVAAQSGSAHAILLLLEAGANINVHDGLGMTPLHYAARVDEQATRLLIERGAVVDAPDIKNATPLHRAAQKGLKGGVQALIDGGADINARQNANHSTALHLAATEGNAEVCEILLAAGARAHHFDLHDRTSLHCAAMNGHLETCRVLVAGGGNPDFMKNAVLGRSSFRSPLQEAVHFKHEAVVEYFLLECGADHRLTSRGDETLMDLAKGRPAIVRVLRSLESQDLVDNAICKGQGEDMQEPRPARLGMSPL